jgi:hypothetical protein
MNIDHRVVYSHNKSTASQYQRSLKGIARSLVTSFQNLRLIYTKVLLDNTPRELSEGKK